MARFDGKPLIEHVADGLRPQVETLVVAGRAYPLLTSIDDRPAPGLGPLGGLCGALDYAQANGYDAVLSAPCDATVVPPLGELLPATGGVLRGWPLFGLWPTGVADMLHDHLTRTQNHSVYGWIAAADIPQFPAPAGLVNVNRPDDLAVRGEIAPDRGTDT